MASLREPLHADDPVQVVFQTPEHHSYFINSGTVKWSTRSDGAVQTGIHMLSENKLSLPLKHLNDALRKSPPGAHPTPTADSRAYDLAFETYWGYIFWTFKDILQSNFSALSCDLSIGVFYLEKIFENLQQTEAPPELWNKSLETLRKLDSGINCFNKFVTLFRAMQNEHKEFLPEDLPDLIVLDSLLADRIDAFKSKLESLMIPYAGEICFHSSHSPKLLACPKRFTRGLDLLLLHSYQSIISHGAKKLHVHLWENQKVTVIDFINDGSRTLRDDSLELQSDQGHPLVDFHPNDRKQVAWILYGLQFFADLKASALIRNESGKNVLSLRIPSVPSKFQ
jgi:hypothetical protein